MEVIINVVIISVALPITWRITSRYYINKLSEARNQLIEKDQLIEKHQNQEDAQQHKIVDLEKELIRLESELKNIKFDKDEIQGIIKSSTNTSIIENKKFYDENFDELESSIDEINRDLEKSRSERKKLLEVVAAAAAGVGDLQSSLLKSNVRGLIGESILEDILKHAGYNNDVDFVLQKIQDDKKPDCVLNISTRDKLIVDSKFPFDKYYAAHKEIDSDKKKQLLQEHVSAIRKHINNLSKKNYQLNIEDAFEKVFMFIPIEGAYIDAVQVDGGLHAYGLEKNIVLCTPSSLLVFLDFFKSQKLDEEISIKLLEMKENLKDIFSKFPAFLEHLYGTYESANTLVSRLNSLGGSASTTIVNKLVKAENSGMFSLSQATINRRKKVDLEIESELSFEKITKGKDKLDNHLDKENHKELQAAPPVVVATPAPNVVPAAATPAPNVVPAAATPALNVVPPVGVGDSS